ncbi:phosphodiesterase [Lagierella sp.]|uniref:phosphodiesterase n=1 Tax=Lagierella sp. TaxID=2849657 RepID=UPI00263051E3|nr:phosphodiesterase [Lagierella sp.]
MKIGILSDTHGDLVQGKKALEMLKDCDEIIHCGDVLYHGPRNDLPENYNPKELAKILSEQGNIHYIRGNCDADVDEMVIGKNLQMKENLFFFDDIVIYGVHGYEESEVDRINRAKEKGARFVVSGHTHIKVLEEVDGIIVINPGSTTVPKDGSTSVARIYDNKVELLDLENGDVLKSMNF